MSGKPYRTLDGSTVTKLVRPERQGSRNLSLAQAVVMPGQSTLTHSHRASEEIYYILEGRGVLAVEARAVALEPGGAHLIRPGQKHCVTCTSEEPLRILCACSPPYGHHDTVLDDGVVV